MKACIPFLDIMMTGYMLVTPFDIFVGRKDNGELNVRWSGPEQWSDFIGERPKELGHTIPRPAGHEPNGMVWSSRWGWKTPRGYSVLVTHPFNHYDLPFTTLNAFMDSDKYFSNGNIPFFFKEGFEGRILAGTPFAQLIPVHRKSWKQVNDFGLAVETKQQGLITRENEHYYKRFLWERKSYN